MVLILGAAYAGKRDIAHQIYGVEAFCSGADADFSVILNAAAVTDYQILVCRILDAGKSPQEFTNRLLSQNPDAVILMNEVGAGIVPLERTERIWREECGICAQMLARHAETVIRVVCGLPQLLKGVFP